jgi:hypothetical protein
MTVKPQLLETAPRDGTEIYLLSVQSNFDADVFIGRMISIHNGYWDGDGWVLGSKDWDSGIGDSCATHWLPLETFDISGVGVTYIDPTIKMLAGEG